MRRQSQQSRIFNELVVLLNDLLRSPASPFELFADSLCTEHLIPSPPSTPPLRRRVLAAPITPSGFVSLMLGISLALLLCGSVAFFIGFMLMPWVLGLAMVLYVVGFISSLSVLGRSIICYASSVAVAAAPSPVRSAPRKDIPSWKPI